MTWADAELTFRGRGPPPVPSRISRVRAACASLERVCAATAASVVLKLRNSRLVMRAGEDAIRVWILAEHRHGDRGGRTPIESIWLTGYNKRSVPTRSPTTERYRSGRNGGASKASCPVRGTWVRIPPSPIPSLSLGHRLGRASRASRDELRCRDLARIPPFARLNRERASGGRPASSPHHRRRVAPTVARLGSGAKAGDNYRCRLPTTLLFTSLKHGILVRPEVCG